MQRQVVSERRFPSGEGSGEGSGQGDFGAEPRQVQQGFGQGSGEGSGEGLGGFGAEPDHVQQRSREGSRGLGGFGAEPRQVQQGCREGSGEGVGDFGAEPGQVVPEKVPQTVREKVWETLVQSHIRFNRVPEKVPGEGLVQSQVGIKRVLVMLHKAIDLA